MNAPPPIAPSPPALRSQSRSVSVSSESRAAPPPSRWSLRAPRWLQILVILGLLGSAVYVALDERYLWAILLGIGGLAFGASFLLRRMVGDEYDRA